LAEKPLDRFRPDWKAIGVRTLVPSADKVTQKSLFEATCLTFVKQATALLCRYAQDSPVASGMIPLDNKGDLSYEATPN